MYEQIDSEFLPNDLTDTNSSLVNTNEGRDKFVNELLISNLNESKLREKETIKEKIKFKKHPLDVASKQLKKEEQKKRDAAALACGSQTIPNKQVKLSRKQSKLLQICKLDKNEKLEYEKYEQINKLWTSYAESSLLTCLTSNNSLHEESVLNCLKQLDYHGCLLTVTRSSTKHLIGISGIVLQDRKNIFYLLTKENKVKIVPKSNNLFELNVLNSSMTIVGSNMLYRPEMRTTKHAKIKTRININ